MVIIEENYPWTNLGIIHLILIHCTQQLFNSGIDALHEFITTPVPDGDDGDEANKSRAEPEESQFLGIRDLTKTMPGGTSWGIRGGLYCIEKLIST